MSGYHKYVRLKMDGVLEPWQTLKYEVCFDFCVWCVLHQWNITASWWCIAMCVIPWKQADMVHGYQQWQDMLAPSMSTTDDVWHTDAFSCWRCQRARHSLGSAQNCLGPAGLQRSVCGQGAIESHRWWQRLYGTVWAFLVSIGHITLIKESSSGAGTWLITQNPQPEKGCVV